MLANSKKYISTLVVVIIIASLFTLSACSKKDSKVSTTTGNTTTSASVTSSKTEQSQPIETTLATESTFASIGENGLAFNPLTGEYSMSPDNLGKRSVTFVVNNHRSAMPQRGIGSADIIYEYETEGGQTRLLALFSDISAVPEIGSIRSARVLSTDLAATTQSIFIHFGLNNRVPDQVASNGLNSIDGNNYCASSGSSVNGQIELASGRFFWRDSTWKSQRSIEHTAVTNGTHILRAMEHLGITRDGATPYMFKFGDANTSTLSSGMDCNAINVYFSATNDDALFEYDSEIKLYTKSQYNGKPQIDDTTGERIKFKNVFVFFTDIKAHGDTAGTIDAFLSNGGSGYYISNGKAVEITWTKDTPNSLFIVKDSAGTEITVNPGKSYICIVRSSNAEKTTIS